MKNLTPLWSEILTIDFPNTESKKKFLADRIAKYIDQGHLVELDRFPSIREMIEGAGLAKGTVEKSLAILRSRGYIITRRGAGSYVRRPLHEDGLLEDKYIEITQKPGGYIIRADQYCMPTGLLSAQTYLDRTYRAYKLKYSEQAMASEQNTLVPAFFHVLSGWLNNIYKTAYTTHNVYYCHDFHFILRMIATAVAKADGVMVLPKNSCISVINAFKSVHLNLIEVSTDNEGFCVDELAEVCRQHHVYGVYLMSNANFPDTIHTVTERLELLAGLQREYGFAIIEDDRYASWFKSKGNRLLDLNRNNDMDIIYMRPVSLLHEQLCRLTIVAAKAERITQISVLAEQSGNQAYQAIANAAKDILIRGIDKKVELLMSEEIAEVTTVAREVFSKGDFWMEAGIMQHTGMGFYLVPKKGRFPEDIFRILNDLNICVVDPASYYLGIDIPGLRISLAWYVGRKKLKSDLLKLVAVLKKSLLKI